MIPRPDLDTSQLMRLLLRGVNHRSQRTSWALPRMRSDEPFVFNHHVQAPWLSHSLCRIAASHTSTFRPYQLFQSTSESISTAPGYASISRQRLDVALHHAHGLRLAAVLSFHTRDWTCLIFSSALAVSLPKMRSFCTCLSCSSISTTGKLRYTINVDSLQATPQKLKKFDQP